MPEITALLHASLLIADLERARAFYEGVLGLAPSPARPGMDFDGVWYDIGGCQLHLLCLPNPDPVEGRPAHGGRDRHTALAEAGRVLLHSGGFSRSFRLTSTKDHAGPLRPREGTTMG